MSKSKLGTVLNDPRLHALVVTLVLLIVEWVSLSLNWTSNAGRMRWAVRLETLKRCPQSADRSPTLV